VEQHTTRFAKRIQHTFEHESIEFLHAAEFDFADPVAWCEVPDVVEGEAGELTGPAEGNEDTAERGQGLVAAVLCAVEAFVGVAPDAVDAVGLWGLSEDIFEGDRQVIIDVVGVTVFHVQVHCAGWFLR